MAQKRRVLFIDSALLDEIQVALSIGFQGITTNPSLVAKVEDKGDESKPFIDRYIDHMNKIAEIAKRYKDHQGNSPSMSVEVFELDDKEKMIQQAEEITQKIDYDNLAIKVPISYKGKDYLDVIKTLTSRGIKVNCTCGFSAAQLQLAAQAGARFVSLFYNRLIDYFNSHTNSEGDGQALAFEELRKLRQYIDDNPQLNSEIILGSIRSGFDITNGWEEGADIVTAGTKVLPKMLFHSSTDASVEGFDKDLKEWMNKNVESSNF
jgi:transaldolase